MSEAKLEAYRMMALGGLIGVAVVLIAFLGVLAWLFIARWRARR